MLDETEFLSEFGIRSLSTIHRDLILFNEYFHGDNSTGLGADQWTGWTGLVAYRKIGERGGIVRATVWPASDHADHITGTRLVVDGGLTLYSEFAEGGVA